MSLSNLDLNHLLSLPPSDWDTYKVLSCKLLEETRTEPVEDVPVIIEIDELSDHESQSRERVLETNDWQESMVLESGGENLDILHLADQEVDEDFVDVALKDIDRNMGVHCRYSSDDSMLSFLSKTSLIPKLPTRTLQNHIATRTTRPPLFWNLLKTMTSKQ